MFFVFGGEVVAEGGEFFGGAEGHEAEEVLKVGFVGDRRCKVLFGRGHAVQYGRNDFGELAEGFGLLIDVLVLFVLLDLLKAIVLLVEVFAEPLEDELAIEAVVGFAVMAGFGIFEAEDDVFEAFTAIGFDEQGCCLHGLGLGKWPGDAEVFAGHDQGSGDGFHDRSLSYPAAELNDLNGTDGFVDGEVAFGNNQVEYFTTACTFDQ